MVDGGEGDLYVYVFFKLICIVFLMNWSYVYINLYMCVVFLWLEILFEKKGNYRLIWYKII